LWKFTSDGTGGVTWSEVGINYPASQPLLGPGGPGCGITLGETGYYVGGRVSEQSDVNASPTGYYQDTITMFNISANTWSNALKSRIGAEGTIQGGSIGTISMTVNKWIYIGLESVEDDEVVYIQEERGPSAVR
jgi:hypothetical protein